jgi:hypothetical protein
MKIQNSSIQLLLRDTGGIIFLLCLLLMDLLLQIMLVRKRLFLPPSKKGLELLSSLRCSLIFKL